MGGAFGSGFAQGFNQSMQQAQDRAIQDEYKKVLMSKAKNDIEMHMIDQQDMQAASQGDQNALMRLLIRKDPMMAFAMSGQQGGQPQQPEVNIGMNYEEPTAPQTKVTFPAQLTGAPQLQIDRQRILHKKVYGWDPGEPMPSPAIELDDNGDPVRTIYNKGGGVSMKSPYAEQIQTHREPNPMGANYPPVEITYGERSGKRKTLPPRPTVNPRERVERQDTTGAMVAQKDFLYDEPPQNQPMVITINPDDPNAAEQVQQLANQLKGKTPKQVMDGGKEPTRPTGGLKPKQSPVDLPIPADERPLYRKKETGEMLTDPYSSASKAEQQGYVRLSTNLAQSLDKLNMAKANMVQIRQYVADIWGPEGQKLSDADKIQDRTVGAGKRQALAIRKLSTPHTNYQTWVDGTRAMIAKAFGDVGNLAEKEQENVVKLLPTLWDNSEVAWAKLRRFDAYFGNLTKLILDPTAKLKPYAYTEKDLSSAKSLGWVKPGQYRIAGEDMYISSPTEFLRIMK